MNLYDTPTKPEPPERIYGWRDSQLSVARHYGGMKYQGRDYQIDYLSVGEPLVRVDVLAREAKMRKERAAHIDAEAKRLNKLAQGDLI
jgi:hypothetical protein